MNRASCPIKTESLFPVFIQPLSSETTVSEVSPLYCSATQGRRLQCFILPYKNSSDYNKSKKCVTLLPCARICDRGGGRRGKKTGEKYVDFDDEKDSLMETLSNNKQNTLLQDALEKYNVKINI